MEIYYDGDYYEWKWGSKDFLKQLEKVKFNRPICLVRKNLSIMVYLKELHSKNYEKEKEPV